MVWKVTIISNDSLVVPFHHGFRSFPSLLDLTRSVLSSLPALTLVYCYYTDYRNLFLFVSYQQTLIFHIETYKRFVILSNMTFRAAFIGTIAAAIISVRAQDSLMTASPSYVTATVWEPCDEPDVTERIVVTVTSCPLCTEMPTASVHTTVYVTTYQTLCPTGLAPAVYTVTESCTGETPSWPMTTQSNYIPPGFEPTVTVCNVCAETPMPVTLTVPCQKCKGGPAGSPSTPTPAPAPAYGGSTPQGGSSGSPPAGGSGPGGSSGSAPPGGPVRPVEPGNVPPVPGSAWTAAPYSYPGGTNTTLNCHGGMCKPIATAGSSGIPVAPGVGGGNAPAASGGPKIASAAANVVVKWSMYGLMALASWGLGLF
jgi:hypothetical protein